MKDESDGKDSQGAQQNDGKVFTVEEAASILQCEPRWVYRLIANGWLHRPSGRTKKETGGRVTQKSLYQFLVVERLRGLPAKTLRMLRDKRKVFYKSERLIAEANCYIYRETDTPHEPPAPSPFYLPPGEREQQRLNHDFAVRYQFSFGRRARQLAPDDPAMQDDLVQEMSLAVLEYNRPACVEFLFDIAFNRAKNYIKYEACRGRLALSEARHVSDAHAEKMASLNVFIDELMQRGVPAEWIEEVIGTRWKVA